MVFSSQLHSCFSIFSVLLRGLAACRLHLPDSFASWSALAFCKEEVLVGNTGRWEKGGDGSSGSSWCGFAAGAAFAAGAGASDEPRVAVGAARRGSSFWSPDAALAVSVSPVYLRVLFGSSLPSSALLTILCTRLPLPNICRGGFVFPTVHGISSQGDLGLNLMCTAHTVPWLNFFHPLFLPLSKEDCKSNCLTELFENDFTHTHTHLHTHY